MAEYIPMPLVLGDHSIIGMLEREEEARRDAAERERILASGETPNPDNCPFMTGRKCYPHIECIYSGRPVWVDCNQSLCGEEPKCSYAPVDNSEEAKERRRKWLAESGGSR